MTWLLFALAAPVLWASVTLLDTYLVHDIYEDALDGAVISGLFQATPWMLVPLGLIEFRYPGNEPAICAGAAGALFLMSFLAYFKALFAANDGALMQLLWNLTVPVVPFFAWLLIGETLDVSHYAGIALACAGLTCLGFNPRLHVHRGREIAGPMLVAIAAFALSMVASRQAYRLAASSQIGHADEFWSTFLLFCAGASLSALVMLALQGRAHARTRACRIAQLSHRYFFLFLLAETLSLTGTLAAQRAISLAPAVSFVVVIESLVPVFVMVASLFLVGFFRTAGRDDLAAAYAVQFASPVRKTLALMFIASGIYVIA